jgi:diguanylate cyclase (GGDEF)-like protein
MTMRIQNISREQVHRLEVINTFSREVAAARDRGQVFEQLNSTIPNALIADSYYVSAVEDNEVHVIICYDDGEYFNDIRTPAEGTLTNWVVQNQRGLFLPDLRQPTDLDNIRIVLVGRDKTSLSWIGVPMNSRSFQGVLALGSYEPNAFNRSDLELLSNLARHAALALENVDRQAELEERARLDSLTNVLNHGYFLEVLTSQADETLAQGNSLSIIMLDVDYFKTYNDTYGHLAGDQILTLLCKAIRGHIKSTDAVGRWGGEEFVISLPNTNATHAQNVAARIGKSMRELVISGRDGTTIPAPTVSQGIAIFPLEADNIFNLIDLADQRLYAAKNRGRDQIESPLSTPSLL